MTDPNPQPESDDRTRIWFLRLARGIAFVGPSLVLLILLTTLIARLVDGPAEPGGPGESRDESTTPSLQTSSETTSP